MTTEEPTKSYTIEILKKARINVAHWATLGEPKGTWKELLFDLTLCKELVALHYEKNIRASDSDKKD